MYRRRSPRALRPVDDVVDAHRVVGAPLVHPDELPEWILFERREGTKPLSDKPSDQGSLRHALLGRLATEGRVELLLDHDLEPFHGTDVTSVLQSDVASGLRSAMIWRMVELQIEAVAAPLLGSAEAASLALSLVARAQTMGFLPLREGRVELDRRFLEELA